MKISNRSVRSYVLVIGILLLLTDVLIGSPIPARDEKELVLLPVQLPGTRVVQVPMPINPSQSVYYQPYPYIQQGNSNPQVKGPFDFIGQWIQQTPWLPIQVNIPDIFQNIGNGISQAQNSVSQFSQAVGSGITNGISQFGQNVGSGLNQFGQFSQNVGNGFQTWVQNLGQRVPVLGNFVGNKVPGSATSNTQQFVVMVPIEYPGGQQLILSSEAMESYP